MLTGLAVAAVVLLAVVLALVTAVLADRVIAELAEKRASDRLSHPLGRPALVRVVRRPFLPQALRGRYTVVRVTGGGLRIGEMTGATLDATLHDVYLPVRRLVRRRPLDEVTCTRVSGQVVLPYGELARVATIPGLELRLRDERLLASAALPVPGFSQLARVSGEAVWTVGAAGGVWLRIRGVTVAGISVPSIVLTQLLPTLSVPIALPELPYGLRIDALRPGADGLVVDASADAPVFRLTPA